MSTYRWSICGIPLVSALFQTLNACLLEGNGFVLISCIAKIIIHAVCASKLLIVQFAGFCNACIKKQRRILCFTRMKS